MNDFIFVYGTLKPTESNVFAQRLSNESTIVGTSSIRGHLIYYGNDNGTVYHAAYIDETYGCPIDGYVLSLKDSKNTLSWIDEYEGENYSRCCKLFSVVPTESTMPIAKLMANIYLPNKPPPSGYSPFPEKQHKSLQPYINKLDTTIKEKLNTLRALNEEYQKRLFRVSF